MDLICLSHLRWNFVYQRPQHLLSRFAKKSRVFYIEESISHNINNNYLEVSAVSENVWVIVPFLNENLSDEQRVDVEKQLLSQLLLDFTIQEYLCWYYTPMALPFSKHLTPQLVIYDCMDELSAFKFAPPALRALENELFKKADVVFTGGYSLYNAKKNAHHNIHPFPSSIDKSHFGKARLNVLSPPDQAAIAAPRFGYYGVIDERFDIDLIGEVAQRKPEWQFIIIGPVVKIDPASLPVLTNIHYLGSKSYNELPAYLSGWDVAMIPFVLNESTKYISPTKTPEYLAGGKPVISSSIADVINPYAINNVVHIADTATDFIYAAEKELRLSNKNTWLADVDHLLAGISWDKTWNSMMEVIDNTFKGNKNLLNNLNEEIYV